MLFISPGSKAERIHRRYLKLLRLTWLVFLIFQLTFANITRELSFLTTLLQCGANSKLWNSKLIRLVTQSCQVRNFSIFSLFSDQIFHRQDPDNNEIYRYVWYYVTLDYDVSVMVLALFRQIYFKNRKINRWLSLNLCIFDEFSWIAMAIFFSVPLVFPGMFRRKENECHMLFFVSNLFIF